MKGFTLVELLIALVLASLLAVLMFGGLSIATSSWQKAGQQGDSIQEALLTQQFLRQLLAGVSDDNAQAQTGVRLAGLHGDEQQLMFLAYQPKQLGDTENRVWYRLAMVETDAGPSFSLQILTNPEPEAPGGQVMNERIDHWRDLEGAFISDGETHELADRRLEGVQFSYLRLEDGQGDWVRAWEEQSLPALIRLQFQVDEQQQRYWPELVVQPREHAYGIRQIR